MPFAGKAKPRQSCGGGLLLGQRKTGWMSNRFIYYVVVVTYLV